MTRLHYENSDTRAILADDWWAFDRAALANERTLLAYGRLSLGLLVAGLAVAGMLHSRFIVAIGWTVAAAALMVFALGVSRFVRERALLRRARAIATDCTGSDGS